MEVGNYGAEVTGTAILYRETRKGLTSEFKRELNQNQV